MAVGGICALCRGVQQQAAGSAGSSYGRDGTVLAGYVLSGWATQVSTYFYEYNGSRSTALYVVPINVGRVITRYRVCAVIYSGRDVELPIMQGAQSPIHPPYSGMAPHYY